LYCRLFFDISEKVEAGLVRAPVRIEKVDVIVL